MPSAHYMLPVNLLKHRIYDLWNSCEICETRSNIGKYAPPNRIFRTILKSVRDVCLCTRYVPKWLYRLAFWCSLSQALFQPRNLFRHMRVCVYVYRVEKSTANKQNRNSHRGAHTHFEPLFNMCVFCHNNGELQNLPPRQLKLTQTQKLKLIFSDTFSVEWKIFGEWRSLFVFRHVPFNHLLDFLHSYMHLSHRDIRGSKNKCSAVYVH